MTPHNELPERLRAIADSADDWNAPIGTRVDLLAAAKYIEQLPQSIVSTPLISGRSIYLEIPYPPSVNTYWRHARGRTYLSPAGRAYKAAVRTLLSAREGFTPCDRLAADILVHPPTKRRFDLDNRLKGPLDALEAAGIIPDDEQIDDLRIRRGPKQPPGSTRVTLTAIE